MGGGKEWERKGRLSKNGREEGGKEGGACVTHNDFSLGGRLRWAGQMEEEEEEEDACNTYVHRAAMPKTGM